MQTTLVLLKPDTIERNLIGSVIQRFEDKWLKIVWLKMMQLDDKIIEEHYGFYSDKPFFPKLKAYMTKIPIVAMAIAWVQVIDTTRKMVWATNPQEAEPWSVRWDFWLTIDGNLIHASDSEESAEKELKRFFKWQDVFDYKKLIDEVL